MMDFEIVESLFRLMINCKYNDKVMMDETFYILLGGVFNKHKLGLEDPMDVSFFSFEGEVTGVEASE